MMSSRTKFDNETEKELYEKSLTSSVQKAINSSEGAVKEKHARIVVIASHKEKSSLTYWSIVRRLPLQDNPLVAWKFCHVTHKLLRDGHKNVLPESFHSVKFMNEVGKMWGHLKDGYGILISCYVKLLEQKLHFHKKMPLIPGNLAMDDNKLDEICNKDINSYFELSVDMLDYLDSILQLQAIVFNSLDVTRTNSMTSSGQCKLAPLIICIQDSCQLYHFLVQIIFKLHSSLPAETLAGHRERFYKAFNALKQFYTNAKNLQYFKNLIQIPDLPTSPPNFLQASELNSHVKPMALVPQQQEEVTTEAEINDHADEIALLQSLLMEKEAVIKRLNQDIANNKIEVERVKREHQAMILSATNKIREFEIEFEAQKRLIDSISQENEMLKTSIKEFEKPTEADKTSSLEKLAQVNEDRFVKMKDIYVKLREEHVTLLKTYTDSLKQVAASKKEVEVHKEKIEKLQTEMTLMKEDRNKVEEKLLQSSNAAEKLSEALSSNELLLIKNTISEQRILELEESLNGLDTVLKHEKEINSEKLLELEKILNSNTITENNLQLAETEKSQLLEKVNEMARYKQLADDQIATLSKENTDKNSSLITLQTEFEKLVNDFSAVNSRFNELNDSKVMLQTKFEDLQSFSNEKSLQLEKIREELKLAQSEVTTLKENLAVQSFQLNVSEETNKKINSDKTFLEDELKKLSQEIELVNAEKILEKTLKIEEENKRKIEEECFRKQTIEKIVVSNIAVVRQISSKIDDPVFLAIRSTAEYLLEVVSSTKKTFKEFFDVKLLYDTSSSTFHNFIEKFCDFIQCFNMLLHFGFATAHSSSSEASEELITLCERIGLEETRLLQSLVDGSSDEYLNISAVINQLLDRIIVQTTALLPKIDDVEVEKFDDMIDKEMLQTTIAIEQAANRLAEILKGSKSNQSGFQLEVNEKLLDSCNNLMMKIRILIEKSKILQKEIVDQGKGTSSIKDFYKKHNRWTEGLISAAKAVGFGANILVDAADNVVNGQGKFEELVVCAQEIAASTAQLVAASKVKAAAGSLNLIQMSEASKGVSEATGLVVASAKSGAERMDEMELFDFTKLTLHQAKRKEMDSQIKVLELESNLEKERRRLAELRKIHYQLDEDLE